MGWYREQISSYKNFVEAAENYCAYVESLTNGRPDKLYRELRSLLSRLVWEKDELFTHFVGISEAAMDQFMNSIPPEISDVDYSDEADLLIDIASVRGCLENLFEPEAENAKKIENEQYEAEVTRVCMLYDDLADLYYDLKTGLVYSRIATDHAESEAVFHWTTLAESNWAPHLYTALLTLQELILKYD